MKKTVFRWAFVITAIILSFFSGGCDSDSKRWDLVTTKDGLVYKIDKRTGAVTLIVGTQATKVEDLDATKSHPAETNYFRTWSNEKVEYLGDAEFTVKTDWRDGKMLYIVNVSPYDGKIKAAREKIGASTRFIIHYYDIHGFELLTVDLPMSEMSSMWGADSKISSLTANASISCSLDNYKGIDHYIIGWGGFGE